jgi:heme/copper-type cytochrome/quinol oxidase subunit 2
MTMMMMMIIIIIIIIIIYSFKLIWNQSIKQRNSSKKQTQTEPSMMISLWRLDLIRVKKLYLRKESYFTHKFNTWHQHRNSRSWTGKNIQVPQYRGKWRFTVSRNERKFEEVTHQKIKNNTEMWVECQEENCSSWMICLPGIIIHFWFR